MPCLVAVDATPGGDFVEALVRAWEAGDAVLPVDPRLPSPERAALLAALRPGEEVADGDALVVATSGTTGAPKGVVLTRAAVASHARAASARLAVDPAADAWLACLPLSHLGGLGVVCRALVTSTTLTFDETAAATLVSLVPSQLERFDLDRFRTVLVGGSADWSRRPPHVVHTYGLTETGGGVVYDGVPLDGTEVRVDTEGQLLVRGPTLLRCYRDGTTPVDADGWLATGDVGDVVDGRVTVHGRRDDLIVTGGEKVWPGRVEVVLRTHPGVADVAVIGRADPHWGQRVVARVVPTDPASPPTVVALRAWVKERLPPWYAPREVELVGALSRTAGGKLRRR
ncbi:MAG: class I adenylate-forming enzyme family protein [Acidimicrobiales bacterium]